MSNYHYILNQMKKGRVDFFPSKITRAMEKAGLVKIENKIDKIGGLIHKLSLTPKGEKALQDLPLIN